MRHSLFHGRVHHLVGSPILLTIPSRPFAYSGNLLTRFRSLASANPMSYLMHSSPLGVMFHSSTYALFTTGMSCDRRLCAVSTQFSVFASIPLVVCFLRSYFLMVFVPNAMMILMFCPSIPWKSYFLPKIQFWLLGHPGLMSFEIEVLAGGITLPFLMTYWPNVFLDVNEKLKFSYLYFIHWFCQFTKHGLDLTSYPVRYLLKTQKLHDLVVDELCSIPVDDIMPLSRLVSYFDFDCIIYLYHNKGSVILRIREIHIPFSASGELLRTPTAVYE
ncbi:cysteine/Histidine-rich C1 domain family protein [Striga asiatica]|uniref:Cysteine/Histidine-rich C1 domain family protein n=1 Tax=Striga asiatica TaxID=4170 RepID=A0A5A7R691_STRAF|nr:cysteine/Histidine-rich C1 domain family protein [Striga asiatica]